MNLLFVTWDGPQVTYLEALFGPIFQGLLKEGYKVHVLQFTWADRDRTRAIAKRCETLGLTYEARRIWRVPRSFAALATACLGALHIRKLVGQRKTDVVLARSILPALASLLALRAGTASLVFDADGLLLDEMVDFAGLSPTGFAYRFLRAIEAMAVRRAVSVMARSSAACRTLLARAGAGTDPDKFFVVTNGRDVQQYRCLGANETARVRRTLGITDSAPVAVYAGSLGPKYCLIPMLELFQAIRSRRADAVLLLLTTAPEYFHALDDAALKGGVRLLCVRTEEVPSYLSASDVGLALIEPAYSMHAASAVKTAEYLLCGVPVVANRGIGDIADILGPDTGIVLDNAHRPSAWHAAAEWFLDEVLPAREQFRARCRELGQREFSLDEAVASYARALAPAAQTARRASTQGADVTKPGEA